MVSSSLDSILVPVDGLQLAAGGVFGLGKDLGHFLEVVELHGNGAEGFEEILPVFSNLSIVGAGTPVLSESVLLLYPLSSLLSLQFLAIIVISSSGCLA